MGTTLNKTAYQKLIQKNLDWLDQVAPDHSLEKEHIKHILTWSIRVNYDEPHKLVRYEWGKGD